MLYFSNLYNQLNLYYNLQEELYIQNQSVLNFALGNKMVISEIEKDEKSGIESSYITKSYGLLSLVLSKSFIGNDTVAAVHFTGAKTIDKNAVYLSNFSKSLIYSGRVKLVGDNFLPNTFIETSYINNAVNNLIIEGKNTLSEPKLPELNPAFKKVFSSLKAQKTKLSEVEKPLDSIYFNSFFNDTKEIEIKSTLSNIIIKGNFLLTSQDSIRVRKGAVLEDVILIAPKITFEEGFEGTVQAFAFKGIELEDKVTLNYPSVICVLNESTQEAKIKIKKESFINGAIVLAGNSDTYINKNSIEIDEKSVIYGDIYCSGKLMLKSNVYGSVYTNRFFFKTMASSYDNLISEIEINTAKRPNYYVSIPLFNSQNTVYGIIKKVL
ncbi:hypothetical protein ACFSJW_22075 [Flavobacterium artemisiae]|uniref:Polymer-forming protein n=1 Tax=Flavobacterium artemisiae TaxID=2126556 RepID=A0ABW4HAM2_9FLAO